jgi:hypothetical protein
MHDDEFNDIMICGPIVATLIGFAGATDEKLAAMIDFCKSIERGIHGVMAGISRVAIASW